MSVLISLTAEQKKIRRMALDLARSNKLAEPEIIKIYWFPDDHEIRLVEVERTLSPSTSDYVEPFYFSASPRDLLLAPSAIALIRSDEAESLQLPDAWQQKWGDAEIWECRVYDDLLTIQ